MAKNRMADKVIMLSDIIAAKAEANSLRKKAAERAIQEKKEKDQKEKCASIMLNVEDIVVNAAERGARSAIIYTLTNDDIGHDGIGWKSWPIGTATLLVQALRNEGFKAQMEYKGTPRGNYVIVASW